MAHAKSSNAEADDLGSRFPDDVVVEETDAGLLVYEEIDEYGSRRLIGFADVTDRDAMRDELIKRGKGVGALHHLPNFD